MMKLRTVGILVLLGLLYGCAATPIKQEVQLPSQAIGQSPTHSTSSRLVIYNDSNSFLYGIDGSGKINVSLDGKGVGQISINQYVVVETTTGGHTITLLHKDLLDFSSSHNVEVSGQEMFLKIYSQMTSNGAEVVTAPPNFTSKYKRAY